MKRGQITTFIIIGIIIIISVSLFLYMNSRIAEKGVEEVLFGIPIKSFVESCIKDVGEKGIYVVSRQGGYVDVPDLSTNDFWLNSPYYYYNGKTFFPEKEMIESELSKYIDRELVYCLDNFSAFEKIGLEITYGEVKTDSRVVGDTVLFLVSFPVKVKKENRTKQIEEYAAEIPARLNTIYATALTMNIDQKNNPTSICIDCWLRLASGSNLTIRMSTLRDNTVIFSIIDNSTLILDEPLTWTFANKYEVIGNVTPKIKIREIPDQTLEGGYLYSYKINATGVNVTFSADTDLFEISPNGFIEFTPKYEQAGTHVVVVRAEDAFGNKDIEIFKFNISFDNFIPVIDYIGYQSARIDEPFIFQVNVYDPDNDEIVDYFDDTDLFNISETGLIDFTPQAGQEGSYEISISVVDKRVGISSEKMTLLIIK